MQTCELELRNDVAKRLEGSKARRNVVLVSFADAQPIAREADQTLRREHCVPGDRELELRLGCKQPRFRRLPLPVDGAGRDAHYFRRFFDR